MALLAGYHGLWQTTAIRTPQLSEHWISGSHHVLISVVALYQTARNIFLSQENVRSAINSALNDVVPEKYYRAGANTGPNVYTATDNPRQIIEYLMNRYEN